MEEQEYTCIQDNNYISVQGWMISKLHLKGNGLLIYACIYGFSQGGNGKFTGTLKYLADWTSSTEEGVRQCLKELVAQGLIQKEVINKSGKRRCEYVALYPTKLESLSNKVGNIPQQSWDNNKSNTKNNKEVEELRSLTDLSTAELQKLKDEVIRNRDTKAKSYISIQKKFKLRDTVSYTTPELCDESINSRITSKPSRAIPLSEEVF